MRVVIDRLGDRYGNSMGEREDEIERERERKERKRTEVESCFLSRQIEFLRGGFASTFPSFHEERENWGALATVKTETRFRESFSSLSLSLSRIDLSSMDPPRIDVDRINRREKSGRSSRDGKIGAISRFEHERSEE